LPQEHFQQGNNQIMFVAFFFSEKICRQSSKFFKLIFLEKFTVMSYD